MGGFVCDDERFFFFFSENVVFDFLLKYEELLNNYIAISGDLRDMERWVEGRVFFIALLLCIVRTMSLPIRVFIFL
jgi:hypothetical protein